MQSPMHSEYYIYSIGFYLTLAELNVILSIRIALRAAI